MKNRFEGNREGIRMKLLATGSLSRLLSERVAMT